MAEQEKEKRPAPGGAGGTGFQKKIGGAPMWVWAVGLGAVAGLVWWARKKGGQASSSAGTSVTDSTNPDGSVPTTIVPQYGGIAEAQFEQLLAAIQALQGPVSTTSPPDSLPAPITQDQMPKPPHDRGTGITPPHYTNPGGPNLISPPFAIYTPR